MSQARLSYPSFSQSQTACSFFTFLTVMEPLYSLFLLNRGTLFSPNGYSHPQLFSEHLYIFMVHSDIPSSRELSLILTLGQCGTSGISLYIESTQCFHLPYYINFICPRIALRILWAPRNVGLESINICQMNKWDNDSIFFIAPSAWKD